MPFRIIGKAKMPFRINGYRNYSGSRYVKRPLDGFLGDSIIFAAPGKTSVPAWDVSIEDDYGLAGGYSGSPVTSKENGAVFAVASHAEVQGERGQAISISCLSKIWPDMPADMMQEAPPAKHAPAEPAFTADLEILPYLVNRQEQDKKLDKAIAAHPNWQTPLICVIHGNDADCPDSFLDRLCTLPLRIRSHSHRGVAVTRCDCMDFSSREALHDEMRRNLSYKLHDKSDAGNKEIALALAEKSRPVIVWTQIYTSDLQTCGEA
ncbi:MAG: hypothetical protein GY862_16165, partial [Gammaproteobacteria bacterium]|nr:hypothetical protein [Gammaproteobacteria bacterium]